MIAVPYIFVPNTPYDLAMQEFDEWTEQVRYMNQDELLCLHGATVIRSKDELIPLVNDAVTAESLTNFLHANGIHDPQQVKEWVEAGLQRVQEAIQTVEDEDVVVYPSYL